MCDVLQLSLREHTMPNVREVLRGRLNPSFLAIAIAAMPLGSARGQVGDDTPKGSDTQAKEAAAATKPADAQPNDIGVADGWIMTIPTGWSAASADGSLRLSPPATEAATAPMLISVGTEAWDPTFRLDDAATRQQVQSAIAALFTGFKAIGEPKVVRGWLDIRLTGTGQDGSALDVRLLMRPIGDKAVTLAVVGSPALVANSAARWESMIDSVRKGSPESRASTAAKDTMKTTSNPTGGFAVTHDPSWVVRSEGASTVLMPSATPADPMNPELYGFSSMPWTRGGSLEEAANAEAAVEVLLADSPQLRRDGGIAKLDGGGIMIACSAENEGRTMRIRMLARLIDGNMVALLVLGDDATIEPRLRTGHALFATLRKSEVAKEAAGAGSDPAFAGRWSSEEALTSGSGFDVGGAASLVTERILELNRDGTFATGSRAAAGSSDVSVNSGFTVDASGTWRIERGAGTTYLVLTASGGGTERVRCAMHEGQLVLGEPGARKFFTRLR